MDENDDENDESINRVLVLVPVLVPFGSSLSPLSPSAPTAHAQLSGPVVTTLTLFAGTETGLWRSTDWGDRWERVDGAGGAVDGVKIAFGGVRSILALGPRVYVGADAGLFISDDFGQTWKRSALTCP